jgi:hypothetical protein
MAEAIVRQSGKRTDNLPVAAPRHQWVITPLQALAIRARRDIHDDEMEELVAGLIVVQIEFGMGLAPQLVSSAPGGRDRQKDPQWLALSRVF